MAPPSHPARPVLACIAGIAAWFAVAGAVESFTRTFGISLADSAADSVMLLEIMVATRVGLAVNAGEWGGGLSRRADVRFNRWAALIAALGALGAVAETFLAFVFAGRPYLRRAAFMFGPVAALWLALRFAGSRGTLLNRFIGRIRSWDLIPSFEDIAKSFGSRV